MKEKIKQKISIHDFIKSIARLTLSTSVVEDKNKKAYQLLEDPVFGNIKIEGGIKTELLVAEIFVSHIPLSFFLSKQGKTNLLDLYYLEIYRLLAEHYKYSNKLTLPLFETLLQERYKEYHSLTKNEENWPKAIAKKVSEILTPGTVGLLPLTLSTNFTDRFVIMNGFIKETVNKFEIEFNK